nr:hypothetical protein [Tanacetum cinerariifolium]
MNPQETQQVIARDEKWVSSTKRVKIIPTNVRLETIVHHKEETFQVIIDVKDTESYEFILANKKCVVDAEVFRKILNICPRVKDQAIGFLSNVLQYSAGLIPPKKSKCKGSQEKKTTYVTQESIDISGKSELKPAKKKNAEQEATETVQALKKSKKTSRRQPGTRGSSEGTSRIPWVPDESTFIYATSSEETENKDEDEEMTNAKVEELGKDDAKISDAAKADAEKTEELKDDSRKDELPPTSSSLLVSSDFGDQFLKLLSDTYLKNNVKDTTDVAINSLLDIKIQSKVSHIQSSSVLIVHVLVIFDPSVLSPLLETPSVALVTTLLPLSVSTIPQVLLQTTAPIATPTMHKNKSFNINPANHALYHALMKEDENAMDKGVVDTLKNHKRQHNDDEDPSAGPNSSKKTKRRRTKEPKSTKKLSPRKPQKLVQFKPHVLASREKKSSKNHDPLALIAHLNASSSYSHANSSCSLEPYYVTHPPSVVDYDDEYQGELQGNSQEDKLITTMMNQGVVQGGQVDIQTKNAGYGGNANKNARRNKTQGFNTENAVDDNAETVPSYDATVVSQVHASSKVHEHLEKKAYQEREGRYLDDILDLEEKLSSHDRIVYKMDQSIQTIHMLEKKPNKVYDPFLKAGLGYTNPERLKKAITAQPKLYDGDLIHSIKLVIHSTNSEETLEDAEESQNRMSHKMVQIDYENLNALYETFAPQQEHSAEQILFNSFYF